MKRNSIDEAAGVLDIHRNTVMNRIRRGQLDVERVTEGGRERTYVLLDNSPERLNGHHQAGPIPDSSGARELELEAQLLDSQHELELAEERNRGLEELVEHLKEQVVIERARYSEVYAGLKSGALALSAPSHGPGGGSGEGGPSLRRAQRD